MTLSCARNLRLSWAIALSLIFLSGPILAQELEYRHGISLLHELKYPPDYKHFEYANPAAPKGGNVVFSTTANIANFNGAQGPELPNAVGLGRTVDRLLIRSADELSGLYGQLVEGIALSRDKKSLYFRLHEIARWHDGVPITTADVKFTYDEMMTTAQGQVYLDSWMESIEIMGPRDFAIHHRATFNNSNLVAMTWFPVRPAHYWQGRDPKKATLVPPVASGPYRVADFDRSYVRYERVDDYWGRDLPVNKGRYNFDEIRYEVYRDQSVAREAFHKGLFDLIFEPDIRYWVASYDIDESHKGWLRQDTRDVRKFIGAERGIALNTRRDHLSDVRVREALVISLDFEWQNRVMLHGTQTRALSYFANSRFAAEGVPTGAELELLQKFGDRLPKRVLNEPFTLPVSTAFGSNRPALEQARSLLEEAGWHLSDGRLQDAAGKPFELEIMTQNQSVQRVLLPYTHTLKQLGIDARMRLVDNVTAINRLRSRNFDAYVRDPRFLNPPVGELRNNLSSASANLQMTGNMYGVSDPIVDELIDLTERAQTVEGMTVTCRALDRVLLWGFYQIPLHKVDLERFFYWDKFGRPAGEASANLEYLSESFIRVLDSWWVDSAKAQQLSEVLN